MLAQTQQGRSGMLLMAVLVVGAVETCWITPGPGCLVVTSICNRTWPAAWEAALQITACNLSAFEIIPVFLRIKFNPDHSSERFMAQSPTPLCHYGKAGSKLVQEHVPDGGTSVTSSATEINSLDMHSLMAKERLAIAIPNFYHSHILLSFFAWNYLTVFMKPKKVWKSGVCRYPHLQRTILCSSRK